ncbi:MAG: glyoxalase [Flavobacteriales bacterium CG_4_9_14_3_um_filter_40_17]|nr:MAG: glyoxalase [Flavobacteriales bacterium CG_4_9_14_3_um_filter_40_17]
MKKVFFIALLFCFGSIFAQQPKLHLDHIALLVKDLEASVRFYQEVLHLKEIFDATEQEHIRWFSMGGVAQLHLIQDKNQEISHVKGFHFALGVDDLDLFIKELKAQNIYFENWQGVAGATNLRPDNIRQVYIQDPDGYWIEVNGK